MSNITSAQESARRLSGELAAVERELGFRIPPFGMLAQIATALEAAKRIAQRKESVHGVRTSAGDTGRSVELNTVNGSHTRDQSSR